MRRQVLIFQPDPGSATELKQYFIEHGDRVWLANNATEAHEILEKEPVSLALLDLQPPGSGWQDILKHLSHEHPKLQVIMTSRTPDIRMELLAKEQGAKVFLRAPFTAAWIDRALSRLSAETSTEQGQSSAPKMLPKVRVPMRIKITLPYVLLALAISLAAIYLFSRYLLESMQERFTNQLIDAGKLTADWMVQEENRLLGTVRLLAHTQGIADSMLARDTEQLRLVILPVTINYKEEAVEILDRQGFSLLSLRHRPGGRQEEYDASHGDRQFRNHEFVQRVLQSRSDAKGDKFAGIVKINTISTFYIASPVFDLDGTLVGAVLVGKTLPTLVSQMRQDTLAQLTIYDPDGQLVASTLFLQNGLFPLGEELAQVVLQRQDQESRIRTFAIASANYSEILGPWEARGGEDLGVIGVSLAQNISVRPKQVTNLQAILAITLAFLGIIAIGIVTARQITHPLSQIVQATTKVAEGDFKIKVSSNGNDEIALLAHAFNYMVAGLQEGSIYRDLLGRTVSPAVREALRKSFATGDLRLEGHNVEATVLMSDIRNFTTIAEKEHPTTILNWLNEYFEELVPIITNYGGVVDKFEGDAMLSFFGILPTPLSIEKSAYDACQAAVEMLAVIDEINGRRQRRGEPTLRTGIGINTGVLTAGGLGTADRMNYTIIGDTVNTTQRMEGLTRDFHESGIVISENTLTALKGRRSEFYFEPLGEHAFKGKSETLWVYRLWPAIRSRQTSYIIPSNTSGVETGAIETTRLETGYARESA